MLNSVTLMGRLVKDVEPVTTSNDVTIASFTIAVDRDFKNNGEKQTDFIDIVAFNGTAKYVASYFHKGQLIAIVGRLQSRKWTDKNGNNRINWEVVAENVYSSGRTEAIPVNVQFEDLPDDGTLPF